MDPIFKNYVVSFQLGRGRRHKNMAVFPIITSLDGGPDYMTLKEALEKSVIAITEVSESGSVPNLKVSNKAGIPVLLLDGEELAGAKQNRVLNTTILVKEGTEVVIPVSCTERGRWTYDSREFHESGNLMAPKMRTMNRQAVAASLASSRQFRSDQGAVWEGIDAMAVDAEARSRTSAMKDVFEAKKTDLDAYMKAFDCETHQRGLLVLIGDEVVGFDFVSREKAFAALFPKLIKSYAMEAWLESRKPGAKIDARNGEDTPKAKAFLLSVEGCEQKMYDSVGLGRDVRFNGTGVVGSALMVEDKLIHMAIFAAGEGEKAGSMAGAGMRRSFRL